MLFVSCYFRTLLFPDPNADPNGSGQRKSSDGTGEDISHCLRCLELRVGGHMGVGVQCEARRVVTQHTADRFHVHAVLEGHGREGVAQVVKRNSDPCPLQNAVTTYTCHAVRRRTSRRGQGTPTRCCPFSSLLRRRLSRLPTRQGAVGVFVHGGFDYFAILPGDGSPEFSVLRAGSPHPSTSIPAVPHGVVRGKVKGSRARTRRCLWPPGKR